MPMLGSAISLKQDETVLDQARMVRRSVYSTKQQRPSVRRSLRLFWDQVSNMFVAGLLFYILLQNDDTASGMVTALLTAAQTTLTNMLSGNGF